MDQSLFEQVKRGGVAMEHDLPFWSSFMGEPVLFDRWLGYYDGRKLLVYGGALEDEAPIPKSLLEQIVNDYGKNNRAQYIECWLPGPPPTARCDGWLRNTDKENSVALHIDVDGLKGAIPYRRKQLLQVDRKGIHVSLVEGHLEVGHLGLIEPFLRAKKLQAFDFPYYTYIHYFLQSRNGFTVQATLDGVPCALATFSTFLPHRLIFTHLFVDRTKHGASDAIYRFAIQHCIDHRISTLDLGYSFSDGLIAYKKEWGAVESKPPIELVVFKRPLVSVGPFYHWPFEVIFNR